MKVTIILKLLWGASVIFFCSLGFSFMAVKHEVRETIKSANSLWMYIEQKKKSEEQQNSTCDCDSSRVDYDNGEITLSETKKPQEINEHLGELTYDTLIYGDRNSYIHIDSLKVKDDEKLFKIKILLLSEVIRARDSLRSIILTSKTKQYADRRDTLVYALDQLAQNIKAAAFGLKNPIINPTTKFYKDSTYQYLIEEYYNLRHKHYNLLQAVRKDSN